MGCQKCSWKCHFTNIEYMKKCPLWNGNWSCLIFDNVSCKSGNSCFVVDEFDNDKSTLCYVTFPCSYEIII